MEEAIDRYEELEKYIGIDKAKKEYNNLSENEKPEFSKIKTMIDIFDEMKKNAVDFEFIKEMYRNNKIGLLDDFSLSYEEYMQKPRTNCLMTKFEYEKMKGILYDKNSINKR